MGTTPLLVLVIHVYAHASCLSDPMTLHAGSRYIVLMFFSTSTRQHHISCISMCCMRSMHMYCAFCICSQIACVWDELQGMQLGQLEDSLKQATHAWTHALKVCHAWWLLQNRSCLYGQKPA